MKFRQLFSGGCFWLSYALAVPAMAQITTRASVGTGGSQADHESYSPMLSPDGRFVAFYSEATNLVAGDTNAAEDIFLRDRVAGVTLRVSVGPGGLEADGDSYDPVLSADGRYVAFYSEATNLVAGDTNAIDDIFVHDIALGTTVRVSVDSLGAQGDARSLYPSISADGRFVAFHSWATNLVAGDTNAVEDIFLHDLATGTTIRASVGLAGAQANGQSEFASLSADGSRVAFESRATNLVAGDTNHRKDIFVRDFVSGTTIRVNVTSSGVQTGFDATYCAISGDGQTVGFETSAPGLVPGDTNGFSDSFVHDLVTGITTRISTSTSGVQGNALSLRAVPSYNGRFVAFKSQANNLVFDDTNGVQDIFLHDRLLGTTTRVSVDSHGAQGMGWCSTPSISADGRHVGFYSFAPNLAPGDTNGVPDVFVSSTYRIRRR